MLPRYEKNLMEGDGLSKEFDAIIEKLRVQGKTSLVEFLSELVPDQQKELQEDLSFVGCDIHRMENLTDDQAVYARKKLSAWISSASVIHQREILKDLKEYLELETLSQAA